MATMLKTLVRTDKPPIVFVSYSHKDEAWKDALLPQLLNLEKLGTVDVWDDRRIKAGTDWYADIKDVLSRTKVAICLISSNFLSSPFCLDEEMAYLLQARNRGDLEIIPVLVEDCVWKPHRWLKRLQMFPHDGQNVTTHFSGDPARIFSAVANQTHDMLQPGYVFERPPPAGEPPEKEDIRRLPQTGDLLFGRREELDALDSIWNDNKLNVAVFKASGGVGKSSLVRAWVEDMALDNYRGVRRVFAWSFYSQGTDKRVTSADEGCIAALREGPAVPGLNAAVLLVGKAVWDEHIADLRKLGLLTPESHHAPDELDAHPLVREHFGSRLRDERPDAWKAGHERLYEYLKEQAEHRPDTLAEMAPLFQAVHHGCQAGRRQEALDEVLRTVSPARARPISSTNSARSARIWGWWRPSSIYPLPIPPPISPSLTAPGS